MSSFSSDGSNFHVLQGTKRKHFEIFMVVKLEFSFMQCSRITLEVAYDQNSFLCLKINHYFQSIYEGLRNHTK